MGLNIGLVAATVFSVLTAQSVPLILAISCGAIGGVTVYSRIKIWKTGKTKLLYDLVRDNEEAAKKMRAFDALFWATGVFNLIVCLAYALKSYLTD
ncbi:MAG: hypothetical protein EHM75_02995 [Desulfobacteraceae bacterium]|nr:MAG: hypothetical protein EHM75_02995 [Desulfobacteraceae bacterium]